MDKQNAAQTGCSERQLRAVGLGASLYLPCTRADLPQAAEGKAGRARSWILCLEDAVRQEDLPMALDRLREFLEVYEPRAERMVFVRVRNPEVFAQVLEMPGSGKLDGYVWPKAEKSNAGAYAEKLGGRSQWVMPTLETADAFDAGKMRLFAEEMERLGFSDRVLSLRVGGNDLMNLLGVRRSRVRTIYDSALSGTLGMLSSVFKPLGYNLTAPVFELMDCRELLNREVPRDLEYGYFGKTAIHPDQIPWIEEHFKADADDFEAASLILAPGAPAVFKHNGAMCEPATHRNWALLMLERARIYGVSG